LKQAINQSVKLFIEKTAYSRFSDVSVSDALKRSETSPLCKSSTRLFSVADDDYFYSVTESN